MATSTPISSAAFNAGAVLPAAVQSIAANSSMQPGLIFGSDAPGFGNSALSLANGMTAGVAADGQPYSNPQLPLISTTGAAVNPYGGDPNWPIQRVGVMRNIPGSITGNSGDSSYLYFIYNPNQIVASFTTNTSAIPPMYLYGSGVDSGNTGSTAQQSSASAISQINNSSQGSSLTSVPNLANSQTVAWSLIFDRTYDMMYDTNPEENRGVLKDTAALYALMGTFENSGAVPVSTPIQVVFAQTQSGQLWGFTGYISSVNITYGIFRHNMIPSRCEVDLTMTCTYVSSQAPPGGSNSGGNSASPGPTQNPNNNAASGPPVSVGNGYSAA